MEVARETQSIVNHVKNFQWIFCYEIVFETIVETDYRAWIPCMLGQVQYYSWLLRAWCLFTPATTCIILFTIAKSLILVCRWK